MVTRSGGGPTAAAGTAPARTVDSIQAKTCMNSSSGSGFVARRLLRLRRVARAPHRGKGELLAQLHTGLVERVHPVPHARVAGGELEEHQQLAERRRGEGR